MPPILLLGLAVAGALAFLKRSPTSSAAAPVDAALIDPSEKTHPNAALAQQAIAVAMTRNSVSLYEMTAIAIETRLGMPKTAANVRTWSTMAQQGGQTIAGEVGAEVGAVQKLWRKHKVAKKAKAKPKRRTGGGGSPAPAALLAAPIASADAAGAAAPLVPWSSEYEESIPDDDDDDDEIGAARKKLPDWLRFSATQSALAGDPALIRATATVMRRMGYVKHAAIHLKSIR